MVLELASLEKKKKKKMTIFDFFKIRLLSFCTAELKSEDIFVLRRVRAFSGYSFCWLNPQTTCLFTLAYCTVKTFHLEQYISIPHRLHAIGAHGCGYRTRGVAIKTSCFVARLLVHCKNGFVI